MQKNCHARSKQRKEKLRFKRTFSVNMFHQLLKKAKSGNKPAQAVLQMEEQIRVRQQLWDTVNRAKYNGTYTKTPNQRQKRKRLRQQPHGK